MFSTECEKELKSGNSGNKEEKKNSLENKNIEGKKKREDDSGSNVQDGKKETAEASSSPLKENRQGSQNKKGIFKICAAVIVLSILFHLFGGKGGKEEYLDNTGEKVPIKIEYMSVMNSYYNYATISFRGTNNSGKDIRSITYGITAWDSNKMPVVLDAYSDINEYLLLCNSSNVVAGGTDSKEFDIANKEIRYIQQIVWEYEDYDGKVWKNPAKKMYEKEYAGERLDTDKMHFIELDIDSEAYLLGSLHEGFIPLDNNTNDANSDVLDIDSLTYIDDGKNVKDGILVDEDGNPILDTNGNPVKDIHIYERCVYDEFQYNFKEYDERSITLQDCIFSFQSGKAGIYLSDVFVRIIPTKSLYQEIGNIDEIIWEGDTGNISGSFYLNGGKAPYIAADSIEIW